MTNGLNTTGLKVNEGWKKEETNWRRKDAMIWRRQSKVTKGRRKDERENKKTKGKVTEERGVNKKTKGQSYKGTRERTNERTNDTISKNLIFLPESRLHSDMSQVLTDQPLQGAVFVSVLLNCTPAYKSKYKHINFPVQDCLRVTFMFINNIPWEFGKFCFYFYRIAVSFTILKELRGLIKTSPLDFFLKMAQGLQ